MFTRMAQASVAPPPRRVGTGCRVDAPPQGAVSSVSVGAPMLHCNMTVSRILQLSLDDLLADLRYARRQGELARLALLAYCEVRRWARQAGETDIAEHAAAMITETPYASRQSFLDQVDGLIAELDDVRSRIVRESVDTIGPANAAAAGIGAPRR